MIQGIADGYSTYTSSASLSRTSAVSSEKEDEQSEKKVNAQAPRMDKVEISDQARAAVLLNTTETGTDENAQSSESRLENTAQNTAASSESSSTQETPVLTGMTETEMEKLVNQGAITKSEMQAGLARRQAQEQEQQAAGSETSAYGTAAAAAAITDE